MKKMSTTTIGVSESRALKKARSAGFPAISLEEAVGLIRTAITAGQEMSLLTFAGTLGLNSTNNGTFKSKVGALKDFGLIENGAGVKITPLGKRIVAPVGDNEYRSDLRSSFQNAKIFQGLYERLIKGIGGTDLKTLANIGVSEFRIAFQSKERFAKNFVASAMFAGLVREEAGRLYLNKGEGVFEGHSSIEAETNLVPERSRQQPIKTENSQGSPSEKNDLSFKFGNGIELRLPNTPEISVALLTGELVSVVTSIKAFSEKYFSKAGSNLNESTGITEEEGLALLEK